MAQGQDMLESGATGAMIGTAVAPGVGTAIGGGAGLIYGGLGGNLLDLFSGGGVDGGKHFRDQNQFRAQQQGALNVIGHQAMTGQGPSAAQALLNQQRERNNAQSFGNAKAMAGGNPALQARMASDQQAMNNAQAAYGASALRAQEQQAAQQNYLRGLQGARETDVEVGRSKTAVDVNNAERKGQFISGLVGGGMGGLGSLF